MLALLTFILALSSVSHAQSTCTPSRAVVDGWGLTRAPGLTLRMPPGFRRAAASGAASPIAHWADSARSQLTVRRLGRGVGPAVPPSPADGHAEYRRCEVRAGSATAVIVSFLRPSDPAGAGHAGAFHIHAQFRWPDGEIVEAVGSAVDRARFEELVAAVRTVRRGAA